MNIAFIGLGHMGGGMAPNLVRAGHTVRASDLSADALALAGALGCATFGWSRQRPKIYVPRDSAICSGVSPR